MLCKNGLCKQKTRSPETTSRIRPQHFVLAVCEHMERGVVAIVCEVDGAALEELASFARAFHVPLLTLNLAGIVAAGHTEWNASTSTSASSSSSMSASTSSTSESPSSYLLALRPPLANTLADLVRYFEWDALTYVYDSDAGVRCHIPRVYGQLSDVDDNNSRILSRVFINQIRHSLSLALCSMLFVYVTLDVEY